MGLGGASEPAIYGVAPEKAKHAHTGRKWMLRRVSAAIGGKFMTYMAALVIIVLVVILIWNYGMKGD